MELANILELIHAVSDSDLTEFNLQDDTLNISMSKEKTIVQQMAVNTDPADAQQYQPVVQQAVHVESVNAVNDEVPNSYMLFKHTSLPIRSLVYEPNGKWYFLFRKRYCHLILPKSLG